MRPTLARPHWCELSLRRSNSCVPPSSELFNRASKNRSVWGKPCLRDHLSITTIFPCTVGWSLKTGFTVTKRKKTKKTVLMRERITDTRSGSENQTKKKWVSLDGDQTHGLKFSAPMLLPLNFWDDSTPKPPHSTSLSSHCRQRWHCLPLRLQRSKARDGCLRQF